MARRTLWHDWRRYTAAIAALALAGMLMLVQAGLMFGMFDTFTVMIRKGSADLWVTSPDVASFDMSVGVPARFEGRFWLHPQVVDVVAQSQISANWRRGVIKQDVTIIGVPPSADSAASLSGFTPAMLDALREPGGVVVDRVDAAKLDVRPGDFAEINSRRVRVVGTVDGYRSAFGAYVFASPATVRLIVDGEVTSQFYLVRLRDPERAAEFRDQLQPKDEPSPYTVWRAEDLARSSHEYWLLDSGTGASFGFSGLIALLVGVGVTSQTLRGAVLAQLRELAELRALGVGAVRLRAVVIEQGLWVGLLGVAVMMVLTLGLRGLAELIHVAMSFPLWTVLAATAFVILVALGSSAAAVGALYRTEPAELLR